MERATAVDVLEGRRPWAVDHANVLPWLKTLPDESAHCIVTSPPYYGLRSYLPDGHPDKQDELGTEKTPEEYVEKSVAIYAECRRVLRSDGTFWLNIGDKAAANGSKAAGKELAYMGQSANGRRSRSTPGYKPKDMIGVPWMLAFALRDSGWYLRSECIWHKPNPMTESVRDRPSKSHEHVFLFSRSPRYFYDREAVMVPSTGQGGAAASFKRKTKEQLIPGQSVTQHRTDRPDRVDTGWANLRSVWKLGTARFKGAHFAVMPLALAERCIKASTSAKGVCPRCWSPWVRQVKRTRVPTRPGVQSKVYEKPPLDPGSPYQMHAGDICGNRDPQRHVTKTETVGWVASCKCGVNLTAGAVVLDPFAGVATTLAAALGLGHRAIGCELNSDYLPLIDKRMGGLLPVVRK